LKFLQSLHTPDSTHSFSLSHSLSHLLCSPSLYLSIYLSLLPSLLLTFYLVCLFLPFPIFYLRYFLSVTYSFTSHSPSFFLSCLFPYSIYPSPVLTLLASQLYSQPLLITLFLNSCFICFNQSYELFFCLHPALLTFAVPLTQAIYSSNPPNKHFARDFIFFINSFT
jgi:hypothetical protein